ncbi:beta strand repeat-containing protein [Thiocystis violascens]|uniref:Calcium-binding protein n=1 Tax=Thiocystis violascens (strain ATCC 17096 / DSM 198 / 6111) TaxID=765911 RepID=I3YA85_THIV6|nr:hypothetical protein [Thiocystis violascens]AFL73903.1 hypothetical protein Thivi_1944 [Thiocystis violascens DSM 198]
MALQTFDANYYLAQNGDVAQAVNAGFFTAEQHYLMYGQFEGRNPNAVFNTAGYVAANLDVVGAVPSVFNSYLQHFELYGVTEGRAPGANTFDEAAYLAANTDVADAVAAGIFTSGYEHFVLYGQAEGRPNGVVDDGTGGQTFTLTTNQDIFNGGANADIIRGVAGVQVGQQDQTTLNSSDILDGGAGDDSLVVNMTGPQYLGGATVKNIETLQIGTNLANDALTAFDMNVNQGAFEVTGVNTLTYDQITTNERLVVQNVVPVAAGGVSPTLVWANEAGSAAGTIATTYRQATIAGTADNQAVELRNVDAAQPLSQGTDDGTLLIAGGMETITITSSGTVAQNTLNNVQAVNAGVLNGVIYNDVGTGNNNVRADVLSNGTLTKVVLEGDTAIGRVAGVVSATNGLTNRVWAASPAAGLVDGDLGLTTAASSSNLLSVGSRVTEIDATTMTAAANVRFTAKTDGAATNVTFKGGEAGDYAEFELGNVTATGNAGADTFAFITRAAGVTNSTYGSGDTIDGGDGADTLLLGMNGVGTYTLSTTEFQNTTGIDVLDLRGAVNTVTVSSTLVDGADAGKFEIHTDRVVRTAVDNALNPAAGTTNGTEDALVNVINLTDLSGSQGVKFVGGSGSDRLVLDNAAFNQNMELNGGTEETSVGNVAGDYDTLTVIDNAVLDRTDIANASNFEGLVLVESGTGNTTFSLEMTEAFLLANTKASDLVFATTSINDTVFQIGTNNAANGNALEAGDVVSIDVTDLFNTATNAVKASVAARSIDTNVLTGAGVTVNYVYNGVTYATLAALTAALPTVGAAAVLNGNDAVGRVDVMGSAANVAGATGIVFTSGVGPQAVLGTNNNDTFTLSQADTVTGGDGLDTVTFNAGSGGAQVTLGGTGADTVTQNVSITDGVGILNMAAGGTLNIAANFGAAYDMNATAGNYVFGAATTVNVTAVQTGLTIENGATVTTTASAGGTFTLGTGGQTFTGTGATAYIVTGGAGADRITTGTGADTIILGQTNDSVTGGTGIDTFRVDDAGATSDVILDFTVGVGGDRIQISEALTAVAGVNTLVAAIGTTAQVATQLGVDANNVNVAVITDLGYASAVAAINALDASTAIAEADGTVLVFFNTTTSRAEVYYEANMTTVGGVTPEQLATLDNITTLAGLTGIVGTNFDVIA